MLLSVTEAAKTVGCARSTVYDKISSGELSRGAGGKIDTAELLRVFGELKGQGNESDTPSAPIQNQQADIDLIAPDLLDMIRERDQKLDELRDDLKDSNQRLNEHREASRALMSPEQFDEKLKTAVDAEREKAEHQNQAFLKQISERKSETEEARNKAYELSENMKREAAQLLEHKNSEWEKALAERKAEIQQARTETRELSENLKREAAERAKAESLAKALEGRGLISRILNRPVKVAG